MQKSGMLRGPVEEQQILCLYYLIFAMNILVLLITIHDNDFHDARRPKTFKHPYDLK